MKLSDYGIFIHQARDPNIHEVNFNAEFWIEISQFLIGTGMKKVIVVDLSSGRFMPQHCEWLRGLVAVVRPDNTLWEDGFAERLVKELRYWEVNFKDKQPTDEGGRAPITGRK